MDLKTTEPKPQPWRIKAPITLTGLCECCIAPNLAYHYFPEAKEINVLCKTCGRLFAFAFEGYTWKL